MVLAGLAGSFRSTEYMPKLLDVQSDQNADHLLVRLRSSQSGCGDWAGCAEHTEPSRPVDRAIKRDIWKS